MEGDKLVDILVKESLERVNEAINSISWEDLEEGKKKGNLDYPKASKLRIALHRAVRSVDVLKSVLKSMPFQ